MPNKEIDLEIVDSFKVSGINFEDEIYSLAEFENNMLVSFSDSKNEIKFYTKSKNEYKYTSAIDCNFFLDSNSDASMIIEKENLIIFDGNHYFYKVINAKKAQIVDSLQQIDSNLFPKRYKNYKNTPFVYLSNNYFCSNFYFVNPEDYSKYYNSNIFNLYNLKNNTSTEILNWPKSIQYTRNPEMQYCINSKNEIVGVVNSIDSFYIIDCKIGTISTLPIENKYFVTPDHYEKINLESERLVYDTKYSITNFNYKSIIFDEENKNYILRFTPKINIENPTYEDVKTIFLIVDENFGVLNYYASKQKYFGGGCEVELKNKGVYFAKYFKNYGTEEINYYSFRY